MKFECDCKYCPLAWEERGYDDIDAGCHWYDDFYGNKFICLLPRFIKNILLKRKMRLTDKYWCREEERQSDVLRKL